VTLIFNAYENVEYNCGEKYGEPDEGPKDYVKYCENVHPCMSESCNGRLLFKNKEISGILRIPI
jgi:hypothetical protein